MYTASPAKEYAMNYETIRKINLAIRDGVNGSYGCPKPLESAAEHISKLRTDADWRDEEIQHVEIGVRMVLNVVGQRSQAKSPEDGPSNSKPAG